MTGRFAPSRAIINLRAYAHNLHLVRQMVPESTRVMAVVKADAYGHGLVPIARRAVAEGAAMLGVACVDEGVQLREAGITHPVVLLTRPHDEGLRAAVAHDLRIMVSDLATARLVGEIARRLNKVVSLHIKVDTGMGRQGFPSNRVAEDLEYITRLSHIDIEAIATHLPVADDVKDPFTANQLRRFRNVLKQCERLGVPYSFAHAANSPGVINFPNSAFDMVRPGIMTYGVWPTDTPPERSPLRPVMRWETRIVLIKQFEPGASLGYGRTFIAPHRIRAALIPVGYADGYKFALANTGSVLIRGTRCAILGRISMDQMMVDITHLGASGLTVGEPVTLIGDDGPERITAEELALLAQTIPYDILTSVGRRVERIYVD